MEKEIKSILFDLINIKSVSFDIEKLNEICNYIEKYFINIEWIFIKKYFFNDKPSIVISNFDWLDSDIILNGHFDVVPPSEENQFDIKEIDWKIYARWSWDMKAWVALMMVLCKEIFSKKLSNKKISLILTWDEELWWYDWVKRLIDEIWYTTKLVLVPDSGSIDKIVIAEKSTIKLQILSNWKSSHAARPWLWENPVDNVIKIYNELRNTFQNDEKLYWDETHWGGSVNLTIINAWTASNVIPDFANATFDLRLTEENIDLEEVRKKVQEIVGKYNSTIEKLTLWNMLFANLNDDLVQKYITSAKETLWFEPTLVKEHWASDGRYFSAKWISVLLHRPDCANIHWKWEYVVEKEIIKIYNIYKKFILWLN